MPLGFVFSKDFRMIYFCHTSDYYVWVYVKCVKDQRDVYIQMAKCLFGIVLGIKNFEIFAVMTHVAGTIDFD